ncbi:cell division protein FtsA [Candidatus Saccharibacteria bacterium]|nr:cell division protein FtsA [Candidatus Saccharibacteria bacterium]MBI3337734.1 cell division protein FtsA [Candidatus Saccharibacteria bacterium]
MRESLPAHYVGLDIGTSTVRCVVGVVDGNDSTQLSVIGHGSAPNLGMRKGVIVHSEDVVEAISQAVSDAERLAGIHIQRATININGANVVGMNSKGVIAISTANREITSEDRLRVEREATIVQLPPNREIVQVFAKNYRLDGQENIKDPVGMQGVRLEVDTHIVTAATPNLRSLASVLEKANINIAHHTVSGVASAEAVLNRQQKESGTLLLDIGAGTTNVVVIEDGEVQHIAVLPIGGINITNDLAIGLKTDLDIAEIVKIQHASLEENSSFDNSISVTFNNKEYKFDTREIRMITEARVEELLEYVDKELKKIHRSRKLPGGVVLVGGTSKLPGIADFTRDKLELAARLGTLQSIGGLVDTVQDPAFTTAVGLMVLDVLLIPSHNLQKGQPNTNAFGLIESLFKWIKR